MDGLTSQNVMPVDGEGLPGLPGLFNWPTNDLHSYSVAFFLEVPQHLHCFS